jgi:hypothetical protein
MLICAGVRNQVTKFVVEASLKKRLAEA